MSCLEPPAIDAFVEGRLALGDIASLEQHLDQCARCADLVAVASSRTAEAKPNFGARALAAPGLQLGRYVIRRWLGRGGMGDVYEGFDPQLERRVAIKLLRQRGDGRPAAQRRMEREARTLARLSHPNVVGALDVGFYGDQIFLVMELVEGPSLATWLSSQARSWSEIVAVFLEAGEGLAAAHDLGIIHRDFKPQNVLIGADGRARVSDFGLARMMSESIAPGGPAGEPEGVTTGSIRHDAASRTVTGTMVGTPRYMAPEQFLDRPLDARTDQFSFCLALFEALYRRHPFLNVTGDRAPASSDTLRSAVLSGKFASPEKLADVPRALATIALRGLAQDPNQRFPSLRELLSALRQVRPLSSRRTTKSKMVAALAAVAAVAAAGAVIWRAVTHGKEPTLLEPVGAPLDWSTVPVIARGTQRIHCLLAGPPGTVRVIWGEPRQAADLDLATRTLRPTDLLPAAYRYGCPVVSSDGGRIVYEGYDSKHRSHIFYAPNATGRDAEPIVSCADPTYDSHPRWLSSNRDFIFDLGVRHPAVYSLDEGTFKVVPNTQHEAFSLSGFNKAVSPTGDWVAVTEMATPDLTVINVLQWPDLKAVSRFAMKDGALIWQFSFDSRFLFSWYREVGHPFVAYDRRTQSLSYLAGVAGTEMDKILPLDDRNLAFSTRRSQSEAWYRDGTGHEQLIPNEPGWKYEWAAEPMQGKILLARYDGHHSRVASYNVTDGQVRELTNGPWQYSPAPLADGGWLMAQGDGIWRCAPTPPGRAPDCKLINKEPPQSFLSSAPDGRHYAYNVVQDQEVRVRIASLDAPDIFDLTRGTTTCQLPWSSSTTLWMSRPVNGGFKWGEMDIRTKSPTGKTAAGTTGCYDALEDPQPPFVGAVHLRRAEDWDIRVAQWVPPP